MLTVNIEILKRVRIVVGVHTEWFDAAIQWHIQPHLSKKRIVEMLVREVGDAGRALLSVNGQSFGAGRTENYDGCLITRWQVGRKHLKTGSNELIAWVEKEKRPPYLADVEVSLAEEDPEGLIPDPRPTSQWSLAVRLGVGFHPKHDTWKVEVEKSAAKVCVWLGREVPEDFSIAVAAGQGLDWLVIVLELLKKIWELVKEKREELLKLLEKLADNRERVKAIERDLDDLDKYQRLHRKLEKAMRGKDSLTLKEAVPELYEPRPQGSGDAVEVQIPTAEPAILKVQPIDDSVRGSKPPPLPANIAAGASWAEPAAPSYLPPKPYRGRPPRQGVPRSSWRLVSCLTVSLVLIGAGVWGYIAWRNGDLPFIDRIFGSDGRANVKGDKVDVMLVLDASGSMDLHYGKLADNLQRLTKKLQGKNRDVRVGITVFRDRLDDTREDPFVIMFGGDEFTRDMAELERQLRATRAFGGGDEPESGLDGLVYAARRSFRSDAAKVLVLITDAPPRLPDKDMKDEQQAAAELKRSGVHQLHLIMPRDTRTYGELQRLLGDSPGKTADLHAGFDRTFDEIGDAIVARFPRGG